MGPGLLMNERGQALIDAAYLSLGYKNKGRGRLGTLMLPVFRPLTDRAVLTVMVRPLHLDHRRGSVPRRQRVAGGRGRRATWQASSPAFSTSPCWWPVVRRRPVRPLAARTGR